MPELCHSLLSRHKVTIREIAKISLHKKSMFSIKDFFSTFTEEILNGKLHFLSSVSGKICLSLIAVSLATLHYRVFQKCKIKAPWFSQKTAVTLKKWSPLLNTTETDLLWWEINILGSYTTILREGLFTLNTVASSYSWGTSMVDIKFERLFSTEECYLRINFLELKATLLGLQTLCKNVHNSHLLLLIDKTSAVAAINKMDSTKSLDMELIAQEICIELSLPQVIMDWAFITSSNSLITGAFFY